MIKILKCENVVDIYMTDKINGSISLGEYIILGKSFTNNTLLHELGHQKQSRILGPFYLLIVGLPSIIRAGIWNRFRLPIKDYYRGFPENWADKIGGVKR